MIFSNGPGATAVGDSVGRHGDEDGISNQAQVPPGFWRALITGPGGYPDESTIIFLLMSLVLVVGVLFDMVAAWHFDAWTTVKVFSLWIGTYQAFTGVRGAIGKGS